MRKAKTEQMVECAIQVDVKLSALGKGNTRLREEQGEGGVPVNEASGGPKVSSAAHKHHKNATLKSITSEGIRVVEWDGM